MMTHREKVDRFIAEMRGRGMGPYTSAPPIYRLLWALHIPVRPPHFQSFGAAALLTGSLFGAFFGVGMYFWAWRAAGMSIAIALVWASVAGAFFGLALAGFYRWSARRHHLPNWEEYQL